MDIKSLSLEHIASWFIEDIPTEKNKIDAGIPILQRNWVWSAEKITTFWDSLSKGIPVGSIILSEKVSEIRRGRMADEIKKSNTEDITHEIIDGQQRTTAIATAFADPWNGNFKGNPPAMLWVSWDKENDFKFHLTTKQHPWGFDNNNNRLNPNNRKNAIDILFKDKDKYTQARAYPYYLIKEKIIAFPVCKVIQNEDILFLNEDKLKYIKELYIDINEDHIEEKYKIIREKFIPILHEYKLPAIITKLEKDHVELTFTRLNTQGEVLDGEELRYSIIKAKWNYAEDFINSIEENSKLFPASRTIITYARLVESWENNSQNKIPLYRDNINEFKKYFDVDLFKKNKEKGIQLFKDFNELIRYKDLHKNSYKLSAPLINILGNGNKNRDIVFIFLYWLSKITKSLNEEQEKTALGALTLMSWFSDNPSKIIPALWKRINEKSEDELLNFWENEFKDIAFNKQAKELHIYPAMNMERLKKFIDENFNENNFKNFYLKNDMSMLYKMAGDRDGADKIFWWQTINKIIRSNMSTPYLAYYFQRHYMNDVFSEYDPSLPTKQNDIQKPWDIDHIIPQNKIGRNSNCLYKFWIHSVGNYCAMDYASNRSKSDNNLTKEDLKIYEKLQAENNEEKIMEYFLEYLDKKECNTYEIKDHPFIIPIVERLLLMYNNWYSSLNISKLTPI